MVITGKKSFPLGTFGISPAYKPHLGEPSAWTQSPPLPGSYWTVDGGWFRAILGGNTMKALLPPVLRDLYGGLQWTVWGWSLLLRFALFLPQWDSGREKLLCSQSHPFWNTDKAAGWSFTCQGQVGGSTVLPDVLGTAVESRMTLTSIWLPCGSWSTRGDGFNLKSTQIYHHKVWHWVGLGVGQYSRQKEQHLTGRAPLCCCSVAKSCPTLCNLMDCSTPGLPVFHHLLEFAQVHVHWIGDAIQPSHPLSSPSPPAFHLSQHQGLFQWVGCSYQVAEVLELQLQ